jgi:5-methylcytosine-specific restriction endonuclease McrA
LLTNHTEFVNEGFLAAGDITLAGIEDFDISTPLDHCPTLVLNADYRPLSYFPLSVWPWQDAVKAMVRDTVIVLAEHSRVVRSPNVEMRLPSVVVLKEYVSASRTPAFTRFNVFLRDGWQCQYCGGEFKTQELTFDHVIPRSRGGRTSWSNVVTACQCCNSKKGNDMPRKNGMYPLTEPREPMIHELQERGRKFPPRFLHESWADYLYWDTELGD